MRYEKYRDSRHWAVYDDSGELICITVYRKGAQEVIRRLQGLPYTDVPAKSKPDVSEARKLIFEMKVASRRIQKLAKDLLPVIEI